MNRRFFLAILTAGLCTFIGAGPALACAGLVTPGGNVKLVRSATLAAWAGGYEHYVTSFTFQGGGAEFGSIIPLPAVPSKVERGGDWTLQRLERETQPQPAASREACRPVCRMHRVPMKTPRVRLRITAYHMVDASLGPWIGCQGRGGASLSPMTSASRSWRRVATRPLS